MSVLMKEIFEGWKDREATIKFLKELEGMTEKAEEVVGNPLAFKEWNVGDLCRVKYCDGFYYDGVIIDMKKNICTVRYIGYPEWDKFHRTELKEPRETQNDKTGKSANHSKSGKKNRKTASESDENEEDLSECGACAPTPVTSDDETGKAAYNRRSRNGKKDRTASEKRAYGAGGPTPAVGADETGKHVNNCCACAPTPVACGCMPKIPLPQFPEEFLNNPLIGSMLRSWFMNGYYAGMYAASKNNGGYAGDYA
ncbi:hypothetical protein TNCT_367151 [Trichonephila clavata]|uniref:Tudor domain-containing protein n=1 Tax=Trichonephila clavata TaxID=2740835 RepID=A0A8X6F8X3_TRICU|nr:hypothetical protein TNCT_367151 [Trichonephila clavata]